MFGVYWNALLMGCLKVVCVSARIAYVWWVLLERVFGVVMTLVGIFAVNYFGVPYLVLICVDFVICFGRCCVCYILGRVLVFVVLIL